jgi:hypothetical protein
VLRFIEYWMAKSFQKIYSEKNKMKVRKMYKKQTQFLLDDLLAEKGKVQKNMFPRV